MKPVCFMVMPFRTKPVPDPPKDHLAQVDFDRLWDAAFLPAIRELDYLPIRADMEAGTVIVKDMLNRLRHSDLVVADVTVPNGNVYYELGVRHVARQAQCVTIAADWAKGLFDIAQFRSAPYPLSQTTVTDRQADTIRQILVEAIPRLAGAESPYYKLTDERPTDAFEDQAEEISRFQAALAEARLLDAASAAGTPGARAKADAVIDKFAGAAARSGAVAIELIGLLRERADWQSVRDFVEELPEDVRGNETVREQYCLALSELGERERAIAGLTALMQLHGETPERCGLLGGRYKRLYRGARDRRVANGENDPSVEERRHLNDAIRWYERGLHLDLNEFYCSSNLPGLLRARGKTTDVSRADEMETLVIAACVRAEKRGSRDPFLPDTLFGTAFRRGDLAVLERVLDEVEAGTPFRLGTTLQDAEDWIGHAPATVQDDLRGVLERLRRASARRG
ncbi:MAG TPA: TRAFs-binding domain-containing protein [bacterium]|nr:TRAFs-binding domain-containing protein [bacterium]